MGMNGLILQKNRNRKKRKSKKRKSKKFKKKKGKSNKNQKKTHLYPFIAIHNPFTKKMKKKKSN